MANRPTIQRGGDYAKAPVSKKSAAKRVESPDMTKSTPVPPPPSDAHPLASSKPPPKAPIPTISASSTTPNTVKPTPPPLPDSGRNTQVDIIRYTFTRANPLLVIDRGLLVRRTGVTMTRIPSTCKPQVPTRLTIARSGSTICELSNAVDLDVETSVVVGNEYVLKPGDVFTLTFDSQTYLDMQVELTVAF